MIRHAVEDEVATCLDAQGIEAGRLLVAVSGGRDSVVLLDALRRSAEERAIALIVGHVHHGLRGEDADADERFVAGLAEQARLPFAAIRVDVEARRSGHSSRRRESVEEAARHLRRGALEGLASQQGARWIATAHHLADQAETVLLRMLRGTGPDGLAGMAEFEPGSPWVRPLLRTSPEAIAALAHARGLVWREDASNTDPRFARNRLRHEWLPGLAAAFNPDLLRKLAHLAEAQKKDSEWIAGLVLEAAKERMEVGAAGVTMALDGWAETPEALAHRLVRHALHEVGLVRDVSRVHLERVLAFLRRGRGAGRDLRLELPLGVRLQRVDDGFLLSRGQRHAESPGEDDATLPRWD